MKFSRWIKNVMIMLSVLTIPTLNNKNLLLNNSSNNYYLGTSNNEIVDIPYKKINSNDEISTISTDESVEYYNPLNKTTESENATVIEKGVTTFNTGWYVLKDEFNVVERIKISGDVNIILADGSFLNAMQGIEVNDGNSLTIWGQSANYKENGRIVAQGPADNAGIGSNSGNSGTITINGGNIVSKGGNASGAGIGGGNHGNGIVNINGGYITTYGGNLSSGIGGGNGGNGIVTITDGIVEAQGGTWSGSGIGGGCDGSGTINISGGDITARGFDAAAGIGGGQGHIGNVTITGGKISASGGRGYDIGDGSPGNDPMTEHGTFSTGENGNAIIHGDVSDESNKENWKGIVDDTVYGDFTLDSDLTIDGNQTLTIPQGSSLTVSKNATLTNNGQIDNQGTVNNNGNIVNNSIISNENEFNNNSDGTIQNNFEFTNDGKLTNDGTTTNRGKFENTENGNIQNNNDFTNQGKITNDGDLTNNGTTTNRGEFKNTEKGSIQNNKDFTNPGDINNDGKIVNDGNLTNDGSTTNNGEFENTENGNIQNNEDFTNQGSMTNSGKITNDGNMRNTEGSNFKNTESGYIDNNKDFVNEPGSTYQGDGKIENNSYKVKFVSNFDEQLDSEINVEYGKKLTALDLTRKGYTLDGWYTDLDYSEKWDFDNDTVPSHDITLYAKWIANKYTVSFVSDEDITLPENITGDYGSSIKLPELPEKTGYTGKWVLDDKEITEITLTEDITVKAIYTINSYTVTFISDDEIISKSIVNFGSKFAEPNISNKDGYQLDGWYLDQTFLNKWNFETDTISDRDITLYAKWLKIGTVSEDIELNNNNLNAKLAMSQGEMAEAVLDDNDKQLLKEGKDIKVVLDINDTTISSEDEKVLNDQPYTLSKYFDIEITKIIDNDKQNVSQTLKPIRITIDIPDEINNIKNREYTVIRIHNGIVTFLSDLDNNDNTYTFESDQFSIYILGFKDKVSNIIKETKPIKPYNPIVNITKNNVLNNIVDDEIVLNDEIDDTDDEIDNKDDNSNKKIETTKKVNNQENKKDNKNFKIILFVIVCIISFIILLPIARKKANKNRSN